MSIRDWIVERRLSRREADLCRRVIQDRSRQSIEELLSFAASFSRPFPINKPDVRQAVLSLDPRELEVKLQDLLLSAVESYLFSNVRDSQGFEWLSWLRMKRSLNRRIDVMNPATSRALLAAQHGGKLTDIPKEDGDFLLESYMHAYGEILAQAEPEDQQEILPILLEYAAIAQVVGPDVSAANILRQWAGYRSARPRALVHMDDAEAGHAPVRGVGSPHAVSVTLYHDARRGSPVRISCAGTTGDETLTSQVFTSLFAAALACDSEPTFVTMVGSTLSLQPPERISVVSPTKNLLSAVIGPRGPVQPRPGTPTLGMSAGDAMSLVSDMFQRFEDSTGLVHVMRWQADDVGRLEQRIYELFKLDDSRSHVIRSSEQYSESANVVHIMPLLHRNPQGEILPIEIEIPYNLLGPEKVFNLLCNARQTYMQQLIAAGQRRKVMAEIAYQEQDEKVKDWAALDEEERNRICEQYPFVTVTHSYNFELGIVVPLSSPEQVPHREYENFYRPQMRDHAKEWAERFSALCQQLEELNSSGGKADILTFKLLIDSMIRRAPVLVAQSEFQEEYRKWIELSSTPVWAVIEDWAGRRGLSPRLLAADNIVFNASFGADQQKILIQPWVMIDLHDFVVRVDCRQGLMEVFPTGKTPTLTSLLIQDSSAAVEDLQNLYDRFCSWIVDTLQLPQQREAPEDSIRTGIIINPQVAALIQLERAKRFLLKGQASLAISTLDAVRNADLAPIYFWGAVANQFGFLEYHPATTDRIASSSQDRNRQLLNTSIGMIIEFLRQQSELAAEYFYTGVDGEEDYGLHTTVPIDDEAQRLLGQLQARDEEFVAGLLQERLDIPSLEETSLALSPDEIKRKKAATFALAALEALSLAEAMKDRAREIPFSGRLTSELRRDLETLIQQATSLTFHESSVITQLQELTKLF